ncbi:DUF2254 domain-containing protein [Salicibibacter halophilus]|uniref:DUF2254 domain-containing protein n=1 Tax=Salicibibacter halophilus TaxID=2502791 RepID=A0A514LGE3_9BACI|nr:DUF2254 domain-containing protein [Salicibibacter halophilus]QDI90909.1 DUF2254 domain-containing protein [Salicibibacter halophilus]
MTFQNLIPAAARRLMSLSSRQFRYEMTTNVWIICLFYGAIGAILTAIAYWLDMVMIMGEEARFLVADYDLTSQIMSGLIAGIITLNAFTLNSILVVLTNVSGQFTPRILTTFISDRHTQHALGIFNLVFVFILFSFFLLDEQTASYYFAFPTLATLAMFIALATFIFFINHAVKWMQASNLTYNMKEESQQRILTTLGKDLEPYRTYEPNQDVEINEKDGHVLYARHSGYIQIVDFKRLVHYAENHDLIIRIERRVGEYILAGIPLLTYWKNGRDEKSIHEGFMLKKVFIGSKQTEMQDIEFGINKLEEIAIKSIGNDDPNTATNAIIHLSDLLLSISQITHFTPYLTDTHDDLRVIIKEESFEYYLYSSFSHISIYAKDDPVLTNEILQALSLLTQTIGPANHQSLWEFAQAVARGYRAPFAFAYNEHRFYTSLQDISETTGHHEEFEDFKNELRERLTI